MRADFPKQLRQADFRTDGEGFTVALPAGRTQHVYVSEHADGSIRLWSIVASSSAASAVPARELVLLLQNRQTDLVEFNVDRKGRWIAQTGLPPGSVLDDEIREYVRALAAAADRLEQLVSGKDVN